MGARPSAHALSVLDPTEHAQLYPLLSESRAVKYWQKHTPADVPWKVSSSLAAELTTMVSNSFLVVMHHDQTEELGGTGIFWCHYLVTLQ